VNSLILVHGGLWDDMTAQRFWVRPGVVAGLAERGRQVLAPNRPYRAPNWAIEAQALADELPEAESVCVLAGSNGCSAAIRFALAEPGRVDALILAWPAAAGDPELDQAERRNLAELGATAADIDDLLGGETLRGVTDAELATLCVRTAIIHSTVDGRVHPHRTADALCGLIPGAVRLPACPETPRPEFAEYRTEFLDAVTGFLG
jgi:pimeloyl-ACP methyl ester carboxylesterase